MEELRVEKRVLYAELMEAVEKINEYAQQRGHEVEVNVMRDYSGAWSATVSEREVRA